MESSEMLYRLAPVRTDVFEERIASIIRVTKIGEFVTLTMGALISFETSVLTRATWLNIPEDGILHDNQFICSTVAIREPHLKLTSTFFVMSIAKVPKMRLR
jgi:hypothetical protein